MIVIYISLEEHFLNLHYSILTPSSPMAAANINVLGQFAVAVEVETLISALEPFARYHDAVGIKVVPDICTGDGELIDGTLAFPVAEIVLHPVSGYALVNDHLHKPARTNMFPPF